MGDKSALNAVSGDKENTPPFIPRISDLYDFSQVKRNLFFRKRD